MDGLIDDLKDIFAPVDLGDDYISMNSKYIPILLEEKNMHPIEPSQADSSDDAEGGAKKILFVDGGNSILFESASFCIGFIRVAGIIYRENSRVVRKLEEFHVLIRIKDDKYIVKTYPKTSFDGLSFDPEDESLKVGIEKCSIAKIISVLRRFAEIEFATDNSRDVDCIILDGTLESRYAQEDKYISRLLLKSKTCALSKTCTITTRKGIGVTRKLSIMEKDAGKESMCWDYHPLVENRNPMHPAQMHFVKLHARSDHIFRFEVQDGFSGDLSSILSQLASNSRDPIFLGYPYGLIDADQYARVSDDETRLLQTKLSTKMGKGWNEFSKYLTSTDAHGILDKIKY